MTRLLQDLGWPQASIIDLGGIASARGPEHYFMLFVALMQARGGPEPLLNINVVDET